MATATAVRPRGRRDEAYLLAEFYRKLGEAKAHLARVESMLKAGKCRVIHIPACVVREHRRAAYRRVYYPPLRRTGAQ